MKLLVSDVKYNTTPIEIFERDANIGENTFNLDRPSPVIVLAPDIADYPDGMVPITLNVDKFPGLNSNHPQVVAAAKRTYSRRLMATQRQPQYPNPLLNSYLLPDPDSGDLTFLRFNNDESWENYLKALNKTDQLYGSYSRYASESRELDIHSQAAGNAYGRFVRGSFVVSGESVIRYSDGVVGGLNGDEYIISIPPGKSILRHYVEAGVLVDIDTTQLDQSSSDGSNQNYIFHLLTQNPDLTVPLNSSSDLDPPTGQVADLLQTYTRAELQSRDIRGLLLTYNPEDYSQRLYGVGYKLYGGNLASDEPFIASNHCIGILVDNVQKASTIHQVEANPFTSGASYGGFASLDMRSDAIFSDGAYLHTIINSAGGGQITMKKLSGNQPYERTISKYGLAEANNHQHFVSDGTDGSDHLNLWAVTKLLSPSYVMRFYDLSSGAMPWSMRASNLSHDGFDWAEGIAKSFRLDWDGTTFSCVLIGLPGGDPDPNEEITFLAVNDGRIPVQILIEIGISSIEPTMGHSVRIRVAFNDGSNMDTDVINFTYPMPKYWRLSGPQGDANAPRMFELRTGGF